ncbi:uncharacterized protein GGS22DRAFT_150092 [Annulohypoxylon maeteangense]|uniref:uncharacterized protein n=1 Tax=Annulohypoxylon maeteangense TaxID=1927788 RepID=UPI002007CEA3|nr:uncharacterized protein GGS22DRAFT_150092 [Annulohypoxylon maeteangense]KAI0890141.1 hypothetical protein GGS22DRAFT_150092 [Annulohypoxylon maeteangense]
MSSLELCCVCWKKGGELCGRCKSSCYCSKECQKEDWSLHKKVCRIAAAAPPKSERPSPYHIQAIFCPENTDTYEFVWVKCFPNLDHPEGPRFIPTNVSIRDIFGRDKSGITTNGYFWGPGLPGVIYPHLTASFFPAEMKSGNNRPLLIVGSVHEFGLHGDSLPRFVDATLADMRATRAGVAPIQFAVHWPECPDELNFDGII